MSDQELEVTISTVKKKNQIERIRKEIAERIIQILRKYKIELPNKIICASACVTDAILITADKQLGKLREAKVKVISLPSK